MGIYGISSPELGESPEIGGISSSEVGGYLTLGTGGFSKHRSKLGLLILR